MGIGRRIARRRFLAAAGAALSAGFAVPAVIPATCLGAEGKVAASERIGVGMIGLGRQAIAHNLPVFARAPDAQVVALCDVDRWRLQFCKENPAAVAVAKRHQIDLDAMGQCLLPGCSRRRAQPTRRPAYWHLTAGRCCFLG